MIPRCLCLVVLKAKRSATRCAFLPGEESILSGMKRFHRAMSKTYTVLTLR